MTFKNTCDKLILEGVNMKIIKRIYKIICACILICIILSFQENTITSELKTENNNLNKNINLNAMARVINNFNYDDINAVLDTYTGWLTGYGADCALCSGKLGCNGQNVKDGTLTYYDNTYGTVRIVASSQNLACGSIVRFRNPKNIYENITAIVLDRGVIGTSLDLLVESEEAANKEVGSQRINYDILRFGWQRTRV